MVRYTFKLFVMGSSDRSLRAIENLRAFCETEMPSDHELLVVDVLADPAIAEKEKIFATPTLVKYTPLPVQRIIGDLGERDRLVRLLGTPNSNKTSNKVGNV